MSILKWIPETLNDELIEEVRELIKKMDEEKAKQDQEKRGKEVSEMMKDHLAAKKAQEQSENSPAK